MTGAWAARTNLRLCLDPLQEKDSSPLRDGRSSAISAAIWPDAGPELAQHLLERRADAGLAGECNPEEEPCLIPCDADFRLCDHASCRIPQWLSRDWHLSGLTCTRREMSGRSVTSEHSIPSEYRCARASAPELDTLARCRA